MSPEAYRAIRKGVGSQERAAELLGLHKMTVSKRERGEQEIDREAELALLYVAERHGKGT